jgi:hypothetical protein
VLCPDLTLQSTHTTVPVTMGLVLNQRHLGNPLGATLIHGHCVSTYWPVPCPSSSLPVAQAGEAVPLAGTTAQAGKVGCCTVVASFTRKGTSETSSMVPAARPPARLCCQVPHAR